MNKRSISATVGRRDGTRTVRPNRRPVNRDGWDGLYLYSRPIRPNCQDKKNDASCKGLFSPLRAVRPHNPSCLNAQMFTKNEVCHD